MTIQLNRRSFGRLAITGAAAALTVTHVPTIARAGALPDIGNAYQIPGPAVGANTQDRHVLSVGRHLVVITKSGDVFAHEVRATVEPAYQLGGGRIELTSADKWLVPSGYDIIVVRTDGTARMYRLTTESDGWFLRPVAVQAALPVACKSLIGANDIDRRAHVRGNQFLVLTSTGVVGRHVMASSTNFGAGGPLDTTSGPVAANAVDKWTLVLDNHIVVITNTGQVFAHRVTATAVEAAFQLSGPAVAANKQDRWVLPQGDRILVVTNAGGVFAHTMFQNTPG